MTLCSAPRFPAAVPVNSAPAARKRRPLGACPAAAQSLSCHSLSLTILCACVSMCVSSALIRECWLQCTGFTLLHVNAKQFGWLKSSQLAKDIAGSCKSEQGMPRTVGRMAVGGGCSCVFCSLFRMLTGRGCCRGFELRASKAQGEDAPRPVWHSLQQGNTTNLTLCLLH